MNKYLIPIIILIALSSALITGFLLINSRTKKISLPITAVNNQNVNNSSNAKIIPAKTVTLANSGFTPETLTINKGERVVWLNKSGTTGTVNSDNYPTNLLFPFLNFGQFNDGSSFSTIFTKVGTYTYYNFLSQNQNQKGTIIVK